MAYRLCAVYITLFQSCVDIRHHLLGVYLAQRKINDALDTESKSQYEGKSHERHEACRAFDKLRLYYLMEALRLLFIEVCKVCRDVGCICRRHICRRCRVSHGSSGILSLSCSHGRERHECDKGEQ